MRRFFWGAVSVGLCVLACNTRVPEEMEHVGTAKELLLSLGSPCDKDTQCTSGHCVDAVCCSTVCHTGAHADNHGCSNVYGTIPNIGTHVEAPGQPNAGVALGATADPFPGTCVTLVDNDPCGEISSLNPCKWRGTTINGGNNCPVPNNGLENACYVCNGNADCPPGLPLCINNGCGPCVTDGDCPALFPVCLDGSCVQCAPGKTGACTGATSSCDLASNTCVGCDGDFGPPSSTFECPTSAAPVCLLAADGVAGLPAGLCVQCRTDSPAHQTNCPGPTPVCDPSQDKCVQCLTNANCATAASGPVCSGKLCVPCDGDRTPGGTPAPCFDPLKPACVGGQCKECNGTDPERCTAQASGTGGAGATKVCLVASSICVDCLGNGDCHDATKPFCDAASHTCAASCNNDGQCGQPKPKCGAGGLCVECTGPADCPSSAHPANPFCDLPTSSCIQCRDFHDCANPAAPVCNASHQCVPCDGDQGSATAAACQDTTKPACDSGACVQCTNNNPPPANPPSNRLCTGATSVCDDAIDKCVQCSAANRTPCVGTTPICDTSVDQCKACDGDFGPPTTPLECTSPLNPACTPSGACVQCTAGNITACPAALPVCNTATNRCVQCNANPDCKGADGLCNLVSHTCTAGCASDANCSFPTPRCKVAAALCVQCLGNGDCAAPTPSCDLATNTCVACLDDSACGGNTPVCKGGACVACDGDRGSGSPAACKDAAHPACVKDGVDAGKCVECTTSDKVLCVAPKPACNDTSHTCVQCASNAECSGKTPICNAAGTCVACDGDLGSGTAAACFTATAPACAKSGVNSGACVECTDTDHVACVAGKPICDVPTNKCVQCETNSDCTGVNGVCNTTTHTCTLGCTSDANCTTAAPACKLPDGFCVECTSTNKTHCVAPTPFCDLKTNLCVADCSSDADCAAPTPICDPTSRRCVQCTSNKNCPPDNPICNTTTHTCGKECSKSSECPGDAPICDPGTKQCVECVDSKSCPPFAPICNPTTHKCGTDCTANADCPGATPVCNPGSHKCVQCTDDSQCAPGAHCDPASNTCSSADQFAIEGGGCACSTVPSRGSGKIALAVAAALATLLLRRRRR